MAKRAAKLAAAASLSVAIFGGVQAELLSDYFPSGVPGYGNAPGVTVATRSRPEFDPDGLRAGSFVLRPRLEEGLGFDDNVFGSSANRRGSWLLGTHPSLLISSDWSRHSLGGYLAVDDTRYLDQPRQSFTDLTVSLGGSVAVGRDQLTISVAHFGLHQPRTALDALPTDTPVAYRVEDVRASYRIALGRFSVTPSVAFSAWRYQPTTILGVPVSQAYRDRNLVLGAVTTRYELSPHRNLLWVTRALNSHYVAPQSGLPSRDSAGYQVLFGLEDDSDAVWRYRLLLGWEARSFHAAQYATRHAPIAEATLIWSPSGITTVTASLTRSMEDAAQEGIVGYTYTRARVVVDHEYLRNVLLQASASVQRAEFFQGGHQSGFSLGAGATWLIDRHFQLAARYEFTDQQGNTSPSLLTTGTYTRSIGLLSLRVGM